MRIIHVSVAELFGNPTYNYEIELRRDPPITIVFGPNGSGKTVIFQMLNGLFESEIRCRYIFHKYPFREFRVTFDNGEQVYVEGADFVTDREFDCPVLYLSSELDEPFPLERVEPDLSNLPSSLRHRIVREGAAALDEIVSLFPEVLDDVEQDYGFHGGGARSARRPQKGKNEPDWYRSLISQLNVRLISTDRLQIRQRDASDRFGPMRSGTWSASAIQDLSNQLRNLIREVIIAAKDKEDTLNRIFPSKIVDAVNEGNQNTWAYEAVEPKLENLRAERKRLADVGLYDSGKELQVAEYSDKTLGSVLRIYIEDSKQKLEVYQELTERIEAFKDIVQEMLSDKNIVFTRQGFEVRSDASLEIPLRQLSSGEQHLIVLMYNLLFRENNQADELVLLDEPEISLNIVWQNVFVTTLEKICNINESSHSDIMIATHSPDILNGRIDLLVPLQPKEQAHE